MQQRHGLAQVQNVNVVACSKDEGFHLWVPAPRVVAEMNAGFKKLAHRESWESHVFPRLLRLLRHGQTPIDIGTGAT